MLLRNLSSSSCVCGRGGGTGSSYVMQRAFLSSQASFKATLPHRIIRAAQVHTGRCRRIHSQEPNKDSEHRKNAFGHPLPGALGLNSQDRSELAENPSGDWERAWREGITPWETNTSSPLLRYMLANNLLPKSKTAQEKPYVLGNAVDQGKAFVPGFGSGADAFALAHAGYEVTGIELSSTAFNLAKNLSSKSSLQPLVDSARLNLLQGDFFEFEADKDGFHLVYDYLFICSLPPSLREDWAKKMKYLLNAEGRLVIQLFPIGDFEGGPPFAMSERLIRDLLEPEGMKCELFEDVPHHLSHRPRRGREMISVWKHV